MIKIVIEHTEESGWICYGTEDQAVVDRVIQNGGWEMPQDQVESIFGDLVFLATPENTTVTENGQHVEFHPPSLEERLRERARDIYLGRDWRVERFKSMITPYYWESLNSYQRKAWMKYKQELDEIDQKEGFPWYRVPENEIPWPHLPSTSPQPETLEDLKELRLEQLTETFDKWMDSPDSSMTSSTGYTVNANNTAKKNIDGLITAMESTGVETVTFMCFDNTPAQLTLQQLKIIQLELIQYGSALYARKWQYRAQIETAETMQEIYTIKVDFSDVTINQDEDSEVTINQDGDSDVTINQDGDSDVVEDVSSNEFDSSNVTGD